MDVPESMEAWCMHCHAKKTVQKPQPRLIKGVRGYRHQLAGKCPDCGGVVAKFIKTPKDETHPSPHGGSSRQAQAGPVGSSGPPVATLHVVATAHFRGPCWRCREERRFGGEKVGTRFDGKLVIRGTCETCRQTQIVVGAREEES